MYQLKWKMTKLCNEMISAFRKTLKWKLIAFNFNVFQAAYKTYEDDIAHFTVKVI